MFVGRALVTHLRTGLSDDYGAGPEGGARKLHSAAGAAHRQTHRLLVSAELGAGNEKVAYSSSTLPSSEHGGEGKHVVDLGGLVDAGLVMSG